MISFQTAASSRAPLSLGAIRGLTIEVRDLTATKDFYQQVFGGREDGWRQRAGHLTYERDGQLVEFVEKARPRTLNHTGQHQAYRVAADRLEPLIPALAAQGHQVNCWREDHPAERAASSYVVDPSGNRLQFVPGEGLLADHAAVELHDLELAEIFYANVLGGSVDYCHGWAMDDYAQAMEEERSASEGEDVCAPWTRRYDVRYWDKVRVRRPNMQLFVRFGATRLALVLAGEHRQEPPPEQLRGTPRITLASDRPASSLAEHLEISGTPSDVDGNRIFLRDPGGNYIEIDCAG